MAKKPIAGRYKRLVRHGDSDTHDLCLCTRKTSKVQIDDLPKLWGRDSGGQDYLTLFLLYNKQSFAFLSIDVQLADNGNHELLFQPAEKVGCAPLISPINGKVCASIIVRGNMNEDISEILPLIEGEIEINFSNNLILPYKASIKPPIYFECAKFIDQYILAQRIHWKKFIVESRIENAPGSGTQWEKYARKSHDPNEALKYPNRKNTLSVNHKEWEELNYVLKMCLDEISSPQTPRISKQAYKTKVEDLRRKANLRNIVKPTILNIHMADPLEIKKLKEIGNRIIASVTSEYRAWSLDFSRLFECYVQCVFSQLAKKIGARSFTNNKMAISGMRRSWSLSYLEPDIVLLQGSKMIVADAKYKMHLYNANSKNVDALKDSYRHDLHQILAYSSFENDMQKTAILVYPSNEFVCIKQLISAPFTRCSCNLCLVGIPWGNTSTDSITNPIHKKLTEAIDGLYENLFKES